ncbi:MAG: GDP-mannose 4,6-dehydratase [Bdellovibrionaceae bacterium]|nr:GDP-mannose 4,6-dehydratase [Pseudobdellovibrionaceae bacterium]
MSRKALITGITGQDGSYLSEFLLDKGYEVHGLVRRTSALNRQRIDHLFNLEEYHDGKNLEVKLHYGDLTDSSSLIKVIEKVQPDEIYNLAAQSHVKISFEIPVYTSEVTGIGVLRLLEALRKIDNKSVKFYQAGSSEVFGLNPSSPQNELTSFRPRSPYGASKAFAHNITVNYREAYKLFLCNGILFNHESPRRSENFVTRKITLGAVAIKLGLQHSLALGNLEARRDWGYAKDYVEAMWLMLQQDQPDDYVIATGESHTVRDFCEKAFSFLNLDYEKYIKIDPKYFRPTEVDNLVGDASKAKKILGWKNKTSFDELIKIMVEADYEYLEKQMKQK